MRKTSTRGDAVDINGAAAIAGRSAETLRRWVWSGRLRAHKIGNKLLIERSDLNALLGRVGTSGQISLAEWVAEVEGSDLKKTPRRRTAADLIFEERRRRSA